MTTGMMYFKYLPRVANCCFLPLPGGRPRFRFEVEESSPEDGLALSGKEDNPSETCPSKPYFRGLPRFFFTGSPTCTSEVAAMLMPWPKLAFGGSIENAGADEPGLTFD
jgi:hypothetical protein